MNDNALEAQAARAAIRGDWLGAARLFAQMTRPSAERFFLDGAIHEKADRLHQAVENYQEALRLDPRHDAAQIRLARVAARLAREGFATPAIAQSDRPVARRNSLVDAYLRTGRWTKAASLLASSRFSSNAVGAPRLLDVPRWDGTHVRRLAVVLAESGIGDAFLMARVIPPLQKRCDALIVSAPSGARPLLKDNFPFCSFASSIEEALGDASAYTPDVLVPLHVNCLEIPQPPYLRTLERVQKRDGVHLGLAWCGSKHMALDHLRSLNAEQLAPLADLPVTWHSLVYGPRAVERPAWCEDHTAELAAGGWRATARLLASFDGLVATDNGVANLAGAMGLRVIVLAEHHPDFRWASRAWYPSAEVFRQSRPGDWAGAALEARAAVAEC